MAVSSHTQHGVHIPHLQFTPSWLSKRLKDVWGNCLFSVSVLVTCFLLIGCKGESRISWELEIGAVLITPLGPSVE